jgi:acetyltransferase-like isoleucine patch superfamily enzyme
LDWGCGVTGLRSGVPASGHRSFGSPSAIARAVAQRASRRCRLAAGALVRNGWEHLEELGAIHDGSARARRFRSFGHDAVIRFPLTALYGEEHIDIGACSIIGPQVSLSAGWVPGAPVAGVGVRIGSGVLIGRGSGVVAHESVEIGDGVFTGHHVYITDANHGYEDPTEAIGRQLAPPRPVHIGAGSWLGHGAIVLPGADIGRHVAVGAGAVVTGALPDFSVAVGNPARVIRRYVTGEGWVHVDPPDAPVAPQPARAAGND